MSQARTVGAYEAKTTLSALLEYVEEGHEVVITRHDRPVAKLVPVVRAATRPELLNRLRALRGSLKLPKGETTKALIRAGRRI
jgi:prevent-host-death family protein